MSLLQVNVIISGLRQYNGFFFYLRQISHEISLNVTKNDVNGTYKSMSIEQVALIFSPTKNINSVQQSISPYKYVSVVLFNKKVAILNKNCFNYP